MSQIHAALSHYWHLRDQGIAPPSARQHVLLRFGVQIDPEQPLASTSEVVDETPDPTGLPPLDEQRTQRPLRAGDRVLDWDGALATVLSDENAEGDVHV